MSGVVNRMKAQRGFTLVELLVVTIIIAVLAAIAIPSFLHHRGKAEDASAVSLVREAVVGMESAYVDSHTYAIGASVLAAIEPTIHWNEADGHVVDVATPSIAATASAATNSVDYFGAAVSYSIATTSGSGNQFGVYADKGAHGNVVYVKVVGSVATTGW